MIYPPNSTEAATRSALPRNWVPLAVLEKHYRKHNSDGAMYCCKCFKESLVTQHQGAHPFGELKCSSCYHVVCYSCFVTNIFTLNSALGSEDVALVARFDGEEAPYGSVCQCGLTHRASRAFSRYHPDHTSLQFGGISCQQCGAMSSSSWLRFAIGTSYDWRSNSENCYIRAVLHLAEFCARVRR